MATSADSAELLTRLKQVRAEAIAQFALVRQLADERRRLIEQLLAAGYSQADLARELGVTRQAVQKMIAVGRS